MISKKQCKYVIKITSLGQSESQLLSKLHIKMLAKADPMEITQLHHLFMFIVELQKLWLRILGRFSLPSYKLLIQVLMISSSRIFENKSFIIFYKNNV